MTVSVANRLTPTFGAEVSGVEIAAGVDAETIAAVRTLWGEHKILLFRNQQVDEAGLVDFSRQFGELEIHVRTEFLSPTHPQVLYISNRKENGRSVGILADTEVGWHYDQIYLPKPAVGSLLCAVELPPAGGDTWFADMAAALEALPSEIRSKLEGRSAVQSYEAFNAAYSVPTSKTQKKRTPDIEQPIIRTHPVTGVKALYLCPGMTTAIVGMDGAESRETLDFLFDWIVRPEFVYRHRWQAGDCIMWDNACTMHRRDPFDGTHARLMKRTTILPPAELAVPF
ncbi:MAG: TauD/TfdA family dioxygenase [Pseudomonadota bacterium]